MKQKLNPFLANAPWVLQARAVRRTPSGELVESDPIQSKRVWVRLAHNRIVPFSGELIPKNKWPVFKEYKFKEIS